MSEPEIARRCPSCGASIRVQAFFCPQCGIQIKEKSAQKKSPSIHDTEEIIKDGVTLTESDFQSRQNAAPPNVAEETRRAEGRQRARGEVGGRIQRATTRARDVEGDVIHRVQKLREFSSEVLDEAGYDPSVRFVLVAAALFVLFIVILLLNKFIG